MKIPVHLFTKATLTSAMFFLTGGLVPAQILVYNGSFEIGSDPGYDFRSVAAGDSTTISGWTVSAGNVDYIGGRWASADGSRSLDMNGDSPGTILQSISGLSVGQDYALNFYLAASPDAGVGASRSLQVDMGSLSQTFTAIGTGSDSNPGWTLDEFGFTATSYTMTLSFTSLASGDWGPLLDGVSIVPVPEPGILSLGIGALVLAGFTLRRAGDLTNKVSAGIK